MTDPISSQLERGGAEHTEAHIPVDGLGIDVASLDWRKPVQPETDESASGDKRQIFRTAETTVEFQGKNLKLEFTQEEKFAADALHSITLTIEVKQDDEVVAEGYAWLNHQSAEMAGAGSQNSFIEVVPSVQAEDKPELQAALYGQLLSAIDGMMKNPAVTVSEVKHAVRLDGKNHIDDSVLRVLLEQRGYTEPRGEAGIIPTLEKTYSAE